jgi:hypothetical protein
MTKLFKLLPVALAVLMVACTDAKSTPVPTGPLSDWPESFSHKVQTLSVDDRELLAGYVIRKQLAGDNAGIVTVAEAIENQRQFKIEAEAREQEEARLAEEARQQREEKVAAFRKIVTVALTGTNLLPKNYDLSRYSPVYQLMLVIENKSDRDIRGVKGTVIFRDLFDDEILRLGLSLDKAVAAGEKKTISGYGLEINQFMDNHVKLASTDYKDLKFEFVPEAIVFADGTTEKMPE